MISILLIPPIPDIVQRVLVEPHNSRSTADTLRWERGDSRPRDNMQWIEELEVEGEERESGEAGRELEGRLRDLR